MSSGTRWLFYDFKTKKQSNSVTTEQAQMAIFKMTLQDTERFFIWTTGWQNWQQLRAYLETNQKFFVSPFSRADMQDEETVKVRGRDIFPEMSIPDSKTQEEITKSITKTFTDKILDEKSASKRNESSMNKTDDYSVSLEERPVGEDENSYDKKDFDGDQVETFDVKKPKVDFTKLTKNVKLADRAERHELKIQVLLVLPNGKTFRSTSKNISLSGSLIEDSVPADFVGKTFDIVVIHKEHTDHKFQRVSLRAQTVGQGITQRLNFVEMTDKQKFWLQSLLSHYLKLRASMRAA